MCGVFFIFKLFGVFWSLDFTENLKLLFVCCFRFILLFFAFLGGGEEGGGMHCDSSMLHARPVTNCYMIINEVWKLQMVDEIVDVRIHLKKFIASLGHMSLEVPEAPASEI